MRWILDGVVLGTVLGAILACCFLPGVFAYSFWPLELAILLVQFAGLGACMGALQGALLAVLVHFRRFVSADFAPALFAGVGLATGLGVAVFWMSAAPAQCGCIQIVAVPPPKYAWLAVTLAYSVGSMLVLPVFAVFRPSGRLRALLVASALALVLLPSLWGAGVAGIGVLEPPKIFTRCR